jgi:hypothetical protein
MCSNILSNNRKEMISEEIETNCSYAEGIDIPLMRSPEHINDHHKLSWMIKDHSPV